ncbi:MAG: carbonate dehydratase [Proteobacteria bacterium]|nr:carbonate dehydratase [Pseudomonadota bacterium]
MAHLQDLLSKNRQWAAAVEQHSPGFFTSLLAQQAPQYMWVGCADSRVPANELVGLAPGELFVHRNVANVVAHSDLNALSVIQFATDVLKVQHIIVVGHSRCGGVHAALNGLRIGLADNWLRYVIDVRDKHQAWLSTVARERQDDALCELNVIEQARNVCETTIVQDAWARGQTLAVHGWVYGLHNGHLEDLHMNVTRADAVTTVYEQALGQIHARYAGGA